MEAFIKKYLDSKKNAWSATTLKSEAYRLAAAADYLDGNPSTLWEALQSHKAYTRVTIWTRVVCFWSYSFPSDPNPYKQFREENANFFKNAYETKRVGVTYYEALQKLQALRDPAIKARALDILHSGQRYHEAAQPKGLGYIVGKGAKPRADLRPEHSGPEFQGDYHRFYRALKQATGLRPHDLRKLALTRAAENGAQAQDLMEIAGWSSIVTASRYLQPKNNERLKGFMK